MRSITWRSWLRRGRAGVLLVVAALPLAAGVSGCGGGGGNGKDAQALLDRAFRKSITSADVKIDAQLRIDGLKGFERPLRLQASGPYASGGEGLPRFDLDLDVGSQGQTVQSGFLSTGDRAFLKFGGEFYEQPQADVRRANREIAKGGGKRRGSLRALGIDPRRWVTDAKDEGEDDVAGVKTTHVSGKLDAQAMFADLNKLAERSANAVGGAAPGTPRPLTPADLDKLAKVVRDPTFDVYVGKEDERIRRVSGSLQLTVPENERARFRGVKGGSVRFTLELAKVNGDQRVSVPSKSRPISDLTKQLGGLRALGGAGGASGGGSPSKDGTGSGGAGGSAPNGAGTPDAQALQRYSACLDKAKPNDTSALSRCRELLR